ncbi:hypothetical protein ACF1BQ_010170 [Bradyrhizobium sp. RDT10]
MMLDARFGTLNAFHAARDEVLLAENPGCSVAVEKHGNADVVVREMRRAQAAKPRRQKRWSGNLYVGMIAVAPELNAAVDDSDFIRFGLHGIRITARGPAWSRAGLARGSAASNWPFSRSKILTAAVLASATTSRKACTVLAAWVRCSTAGPCASLVAPDIPQRTIAIARSRRIAVLSDG